MAIYEWQDVKYLGKETYGDGDLPVSIIPVVHHQHSLTDT